MIKTFEAFNEDNSILDFIKALPKKYVRDSIGNYKLTEVAKDTSKRLGIKIHQDYIIDLPYTPSTLEGIVYALRGQESLKNKYLDKLFEYLKQKNPDLIVLNPLFNGQNKINIITGILSSFSVNDIYFYCKENPRGFYGGYYLNGKISEKYTYLITFIEQFIMLNFFPSFETLNKIKDHLDSLK